LRANEVKHPVMKARYADLVWDFSRPAAQKKPAIMFARTAIDSYLQAADEGLFKSSGALRGRGTSHVASDINFYSSYSAARRGVILGEVQSYFNPRFLSQL
jgi:hypothetical protein